MILIIEKEANNLFSITYDGGEPIRTEQNRLTTIGDFSNFKTANGANLVLKQNIPVTEITVIASGTFTFTTMPQLWNKLIQIGFFDGVANSGGGSVIDRFDELADTFNYFGRDGQVVTVNESQLRLETQPISLFTPADRDKLDGIESGADVNVQADASVTDPNNPAYIKNFPNIPDIGADKENAINKQNSLAVDGTGVKFPTVDAVNTGLATKIGGSGTTNFIPKFTGSGTIGNSSISEVSGEFNVPILLRAINPNDPLSGAVNAKILSFAPNPFGLLFRGYFNGASSIQSQRENNDTQLFALTLQPMGGNALIGSTTDNTVDKLQVNGTISASPATLSNQVVVKSQLDTKISGTGTTNVIPKFGSGGLVGSSLSDDGDNVSMLGANKKIFVTNAGGGQYGLNLESTTANLFEAISIKGGPTLTTSQLALIGQRDNGEFFFFNQADAPIAFNTNGIQRMQVNTTGLDVTGKATVSVAPSNPNDVVRKTELDLKANLASPNFSGTPTVPTPTVGTNTTQIATTAFVQANARPYKVYTALLSQSGTDAPTAVVLENTTAYTFTLIYASAGIFSLTSSTPFSSSKTVVFIGSGNSGSGTTKLVTASLASGSVTIITSTNAGVNTNGILLATPIEIRVYN